MIIESDKSWALNLQSSRYSFPIQPREEEEVLGWKDLLIQRVALPFLKKSYAVFLELERDVRSVDQWMHVKINEEYPIIETVLNCSEFLRMAFVVSSLFWATLSPMAYGIVCYAGVKLISSLVRPLFSFFLDHKPQSWERNPVVRLLVQGVDLVGGAVKWVRKTMLARISAIAMKALAEAACAAFVYEWISFLVSSPIEELQELGGFAIVVAVVVYFISYLLQFNYPFKLRNKKENPFVSTQNIVEIERNPIEINLGGLNNNQTLLALQRGKLALLEHMGERLGISVEEVISRWRSHHILREFYCSTTLEPMPYPLLLHGNQTQQATIQSRYNPNLEGSGRAVVQRSLTYGAHWLSYQGIVQASGRMTSCPECRFVLPSNSNFHIDREKTSLAFDTIDAILRDPEAQAAFLRSH